MHAFDVRLKMCGLHFRRLLMFGVCYFIIIIPAAHRYLFIFCFRFCLVYPCCSPFMWIFGPLLILFFIFSMGCHSPYMNGHNPCLSPLHGLEGRDWEKEKKMHTLNFMFNFIFHSINVWCGALDSRHTFYTATYSTAHIMNIYFAFDKHSSHILLCISFFHFVLFL